MVPDTTELTKLNSSSIANYIYIGKPIKRLQPDHREAKRVQIGDKFVKLAYISTHLTDSRYRESQVYSSSPDR